MIATNNNIAQNYTEYKWGFKKIRFGTCEKNKTVDLFQRTNYSIQDRVCFAFVKCAFVIDF